MKDEAATDDISYRSRTLDGNDQEHRDAASTDVAVS